MSTVVNKTTQRTPGLMMTYEQWQRESNYDVLVAALREVIKQSRETEYAETIHVQRSAIEQARAALASTEEKS
jgi:outer membrane lipopolysaccharide assembly protein LptE/RlpB